MAKSYTGGCACGAIRYECTAEPIVILKCHCRDCQHITGGRFAAAVLLPAEAFRLTKGELDLPFHTEPLRWETQTRFLRELWLAHHGC